MYHVYILRCSDNSLYVGHTSGLAARLRAHNSGLGAAHTLKRRPLRLVYSEHHRTRLAAIRRERQLKGWTRKKKEALGELVTPATPPRQAQREIARVWCRIRFGEALG